MSLRPFQFIEPGSLEEAVSLLSNDHAHVLAGGSDLLSEMKEGVVSPSSLVSLAGVEELQGVEVSPEGTRIGAMASLASLAANTELQKHYPVLTEAAGGIATPQIRNVGTLGGNLCQRPRCFYYRSPLTTCLKKGGDTCLALAGNSKYLAILGGERCYIVHPSDMAVALTALDATIELAGPAGRRSMPLQHFFTGPGANLNAENVLQPGEVVGSVNLPPMPEGAHSVYLKAREREAGDFALVSVAAALALTDGRLTWCRVALGGVAPYPHRASGSEEFLMGAAVADADAAASEAGRMAVAGATPLRGNAYKVDLAANLVKQAVTRLLSGDDHEDEWDER
jgi:xanthine dehydrogenase YagS FAD-binding subunit